MKILITGIGNIGKSSLREMVAQKFPGQLIQIDMDYHAHEDIPVSSDRVVLVEDVHGLERKPGEYDKIIYLLPPSNHTLLWLKRGWTWFSSGVVDLSDPKGANRPYALTNLPIILGIVLRNIVFRHQWIMGDIKMIKGKLEEKTLVVKSLEAGLYEIEKLFQLNQKREVP